MQVNFDDSLKNDGKDTSLLVKAQERKVTLFRVCGVSWWSVKGKIAS